MIQKESFRATGEYPFTHQPYDNPFTPNKLEEYNVHNAQAISKCNKNIMLSWNI